MTWWMWAIVASTVWGVHYNIVAKSLSVASPITVYFIPNIMLMVTLPFWYRTLVEDYNTIVASSWDTKLSVFIVMFTSIIASVAVYKAIHASNATYASLIEISYPVFVAIFAFLIFKENHFNPSIIIGGLMIMVGSGIIVWNN